jgi:hypothetical protein
LSGRLLGILGENSGLSRRTRALIGLAVLWILLTAVAPACVFLPVAPGRPAVLRRIVGVDGKGRVHWIEAERDVAFAWGVRWWYKAIGQVFPADMGLEYVPPLRYAKSPWLRWRMVRSDGDARPYSPPVDPALAQVGYRRDDESAELGATRPQVLDDGTWVLSGTLSEPGTTRWMLPDGTEWVARPRRERDARRYGIVVASAARGDGTVVDLYRAGSRSEAWLDRILMTVSNLHAEAIPAPTVVRLPGDRPSACGAYATGLAATDAGILLFEACGRNASGSGTGQVFRVSTDLQSISPLARFDCEQTTALSVSASADGSLFSTGDAVYRATGERLRSVGPFSSSVWVRHTLVGVRPYPLFAERVTDHDAPSGAFLRERSRPQGHWWLGGVDESGKADEIERISFE